MSTIKASEETKKRLFKLAGELQSKDGKRKTLEGVSIDRSKWNEIADLDKNGVINILDIAAVAKDYGKTV